MTEVLSSARDFHFRIKNRISELALLAEKVQASLEGCELGEKLRFCVDLVCDELVTNVIKYGYTDDAEHEIVVHLWLRPEELSIEIEDDGRPFDPLQRPDPDVTTDAKDRPMGGLGLYLLREMMDSCEYRYSAGSNHLLLKKRR